MSFTNYDIEAQRGGQNGSSLSELSLALTNFAAGLTRLDRLNHQIGTKRDGLKLREQIETTFQREDEALSTIRDQFLKAQMATISSGERDNVILQKLKKELDRVGESYQALRRSYNEKKNSVTISSAIAEAADKANVSTEETPLLQQQQQQHQTQAQLDQYDLEFHNLLVQQRENNIQEVRQGVEEINTIFKDINTLVLQQGAQVDTIESNIVHLTNDTQNAAQELLKANEYQRKKGKCSCIIFTVLTIVVLLILLAIFA